MVRQKSWRGAFRRFGKSRRGAGAVEFALVILPFFFLTFGLAEIAMIGFAQTSLDYAVTETARQIRTGSAQQGGVSRSRIEAELCSNMSQFMMLSCNGNLYLDVDSFTSFVDASNNFTNPIQNGNFAATGFGYSPGAPSNIVVVRAYYRWQVMTPMFQAFFANVGGGQRIVVSTMMFRNEPF